MPFVFALIALLAAAAWAVAVHAALSVVSLAPKGEKLRSYFDLGWWRFSVLEQRIGPGARAPLRRYRNAFLAFFGCIAAMMAATFIGIALSDGKV